MASRALVGNLSVPGPTTGKRWPVPGMVLVSNGADGPVSAPPGRWMAGGAPAARPACRTRRLDRRNGKRPFMIWVFLMLLGGAAMRRQGHFIILTRRHPVGSYFK